jgi:shikimate dehydrogenase
MGIDSYGVVGHPVAHSLSPFIHGLFARNANQSMSYRLYDFTPREFAAKVGEFFAAGGRGLNVTLPHKLAATQVANELTTRATLAGAVNTLAAQKDGIVLGDNTDGTGLVRDLCDNLRLVIIRRRILIVGAGGATRGIVGPLLTLEPAELVIANRTPDRAQSLAATFATLGPVHGVGFDALGEAAFDVVINATSASLSGDVPAIPAGALHAQTVCYDLAYGKSDTPFTSWAAKLGCSRVYQGWGMLVEQAAESFRVWRGIRPATASVLAALKERALGA